MSDEVYHLYDSYLKPNLAVATDSAGADDKNCSEYFRDNSGCRHRRLYAIIPDNS